MICTCTYMLILFQIVRVLSIALPSYIKPCKITDEDCLKENVYNVIQQLKNGDKNLNISSIHTLKIDAIVAEATLTKPYVAFTNISLTKLLEEPVVTSIKVSLDPCHINLHLTLSNIAFIYEAVIKGKYNSDDVDVVDITTRSADAINFPIFMKCETLKKDGVKYINITSVSVDLSFDNAKYEFRKEENKVYLPLLDDLRIYSSADLFWDHYILDIANKIFQNVPVNELIKDSF